MPNQFLTNQFQELMRLFLSEEARSARRQNRAPVSYTLDNFTKWATDNLHSPRSVWLFSMGVSLGSVFVVLRAAIRWKKWFISLLFNNLTLVRNNNVSVAKGCLYLLKCLAWAGNLPLYRQFILRSGVAEEVQVCRVITCMHGIANRIQSQPLKH